MRRTIRLIGASMALLTGAVLATTTAASAEKGGPPDPVRFATFNASLNRLSAGQLITDLSTPANAQAQAVAEIIQRTRPDVLLVNEFDYDAAGAAVSFFQDNYLAVPQGGAAAIDYPYTYAAPSNTGIPSGRDLNKNGTIGGADDAFGFGFFPGQFAFAVFSKYPIDHDAIRILEREYLVPRWRRQIEHQPGAFRARPKADVRHSGRRCARRRHRGTQADEGREQAGPAGRGRSHPR